MLSTSSEYALRAIAALAQRSNDEPVLARRLAEEVSVPTAYLSKILATLGRKGLLHAARGTKGGYRLARDPKTIRLVEVVEPFEGVRTRPSCLLGNNECGVEPCTAHATWGKVRGAYLDFLENTTVSDISDPHGSYAPKKPAAKDRKTRR